MPGRLVGVDSCDPPKTARLETVRKAVDVVVIGTSPIIASWLANHVGLVAVGAYFVLAGAASFVLSLGS